MKKFIVVLFIVLGILAYFNIISSDLGSIELYVNNVGKGCSSFNGFFDFINLYIDDLTANFSVSYVASIKSVLSIMFAPIGWLLAFITSILDVILAFFGKSARGFTATQLYEYFSLDGFIRSIGSNIHFIGRFNFI